jgi:hypothetical protein
MYFPAVQTPKNLMVKVDGGEPLGRRPVIRTLEPSIQDVFDLVYNGFFRVPSAVPEFCPP